jgi:hypothetical protein
MLQGQTEKIIANILGISAFLITIIVVSGGVTDPVNVPKFLMLGITSLAAISLVTLTRSRKTLRQHKLNLLLVVLFVAWSAVAAIFSSSPISQNLYGSYGRNNGFLTYLFFGLFFVAALTLRNQASFKFLVRALLSAGIVNLIYCLWVILFGDFIGWTNPYGNILGTFGNPNFIGAFLGIFMSAYYAICLNPECSKHVKLSGFLVIPLTGLEIVMSHAIQGIVVGATGISIVTFLFLRSKYGNLTLAAYSLSVSTFAVFALLGALQIGPLTQYIYKTSVSLRGQYWLAAWNTGLNNPVHGVGMDAFGDWYRRSRDSHALELPGINTVVNAAHNVPLDIFSFGGWFLFVIYLLLQASTSLAILRVFKRTRSFDPIFTVLVSSWFGYQLQSVISINQIGLGIWGWLFGGSLLAYEKISDNAGVGIEKIARVGKIKNQISSARDPLNLVIAFIGGVIGLFISLPPYISDSNWRHSQIIQTLPALEESMKDSYFNPPNAMKYLRNIQTLEQSGLFELSHRYALQAVEWNPESFDLWKVLYLLKSSTQDEKLRAIQNMRRLDPLNPDVTAIQ